MIFTAVAADTDSETGDSIGRSDVEASKNGSTAVTANQYEEGSAAVQPSSSSQTSSLPSSSSSSFATDRSLSLSTPAWNECRAGDGSDRAGDSDRVRPPISKQMEDISLLMSNLDALTDKEYSISRSGDVSSGVVVFLVEASWWKEWSHGAVDGEDVNKETEEVVRGRVGVKEVRGDVSAPLLGRINNWILVDEEESAAEDSKEHSKNTIDCSDEGNVHHGKFHLRNVLQCSDFKVGCNDCIPPLHPPSLSSSSHHHFFLLISLLSSPSLFPM